MMRLPSLESIWCNIFVLYVKKIVLVATNFSKIFVFLDSPVVI